MNISEIASLLDAKVLCCENSLDHEVESACGSDMMSDVLAYVKHQAVLLTGLVNPQAIRTALMLDMPCVVFVRAKKMTEEVTEEELQSFVVEQIRRFKPLVAVGHDLKGEYGHGMHMVYSDLLVKSLTMTNDPECFPESAEKYGTWELPKLYLHLYEENKITIDYDQPMDVFDGLSAFQVTQKYGFPCHKSQQWTGFVDWIYGYDREITKASQIKKYNPSNFGLYHSTVGEDVEKNDFLENITTYAEQERLEQERLEQERLEQERLEQERLEQERLEQERLEQERLEQERLEQERLEQERLVQI